MLLSRVKDPISSFTHFIGALLSIAGLVLLLNSAANASVWHVVAFSIFGASLILLYTASAVYHLVNIPGKVNGALRKIDHMMIFILIAGTYTPITLIPLRGPWGWSLFGSVWGLSLVGIILKLVWNDIPRRLSTFIYTLMGWLVLVAIYPIIKAIPPAALAWMLAGGVFYTTGAVIYAKKWPRFNNRLFGFHELFHLFVIAGSLCHFWLIYHYI